jgi:hypothetical protein
MVLLDPKIAGSGTIRPQVVGDQSIDTRVGSRFGSDLHGCHRRVGVALAERGEQAAAGLDGEVVALAAGGVGEVAHHLYGGAHQHGHHGIARAPRQDVVELDVDVDLVVVAPGLQQALGLVDVGGQRREVRVGDARAGDADAWQPKSGSYCP